MDNNSYTEGTRHAPFVLSKNGSTRATAYGMSNKIITHGEWITVAWLDHVADIQVRSCNRVTGEWTETVTVGVGADNHSGPAITMDSEGYLHIVYGPHHGPFEYRRSRQPYAITEWTDAVHFGEMATYPSLICGPDDTLHIAYRSSRETEPWQIFYQQKPVDGEWTAPRSLLETGVPDYAWLGNSLAMSKDGTLHMAFCIYDFHPKGGKAYGYLRSEDRGTTWSNSDGELISLPASPESDCFIEQDPRLDVRVKSNIIGPDGNPWFVVNHLEATPRYVEIVRLTKNGWNTINLLPHLNSVYPQKEIVDATLTFDVAGTLYVVATVGVPTTGNDYWGHPSQELYLMKSNNGGKTFRVELLSVVDPDRPQWLANLERPYTNRPIQGTPSLLYTSGGPGEGVKGGPSTVVTFLQLDEAPGKETGGQATITGQR